jgi:hypothetical protein
MSLKFKRNLPIILFLTAFLCFLAFAMGNQRIVSYTVRVESQQAEHEATMRFDISNDIVLQASLSVTPTSSINSQINAASQTLSVTSELVNDK